MNLKGMVCRRQCHTCDHRRICSVSHIQYSRHIEHAVAEPATDTDTHTEHRNQRVTSAYWPANIFISLSTKWPRPIVIFLMVSSLSGFNKTYRDNRLPWLSLLLSLSLPLVIPAQLPQFCYFHLCLVRPVPLHRPLCLSLYVVLKLLALSPALTHLLLYLSLFLPISQSRTSYVSLEP